MVSWHLLLGPTLNSMTKDGNANTGSETSSFHPGVPLWEWETFLPIICEVLV